MYMYICVCIYIYILISYTHTHTQTHTHTGRGESLMLLPIGSAYASSEREYVGDAQLVWVNVSTVRFVRLSDLVDIAGNEQVSAAASSGIPEYLITKPLRC